MYEPLKVFTYIGLTVFGTGFLIGLRFVYLYFTDYTQGRYVQSLILSAILLIVGFIVLMIGLTADLMSANRKLLEDLLYRVRKLELPPGPQERVELPPVEREVTRPEEQPALRRHAERRWER
jgi:hypothetical protein